ncbi:regulator of chromosome condensation (RCC1) protein (macronuclear) [Tetrahymena thermophila SB210]|uniref:Regulator of chromosome condensation (RCC1) protein n=2 Tax=Tetrahymena thermophila (strain SB210) TaxID=312017 RepID=Q227W7_TETTS|nr:regulator of chromosome condensation (RCC1) protein [Tetrahymena thermophila SB210]EAR81585.1 regulator of chromosome condensation (RCC1) protein [Tetrahymena thermophila SB210]|eukprot:XP_001029248.1 regulator of chromosome condensation (RCC1) protein [Tetrahymena thermophila SB210]
MLAEQINQFSQQIQKFQSDYPSVLNKNQIQENNQENEFNFNNNYYQQTDQIQQKRQSTNSSFSQNILQIDSFEEQNKVFDNQQIKKNNRSISACLNNGQNRQQQEIQQKKNLRLNTQGNNALIERCETEQVKQMSNKNQGMIKLDQILPNYFTNHRVLTESADFSVKNINRFQSNQQVNVVSQSIPGNFKQEAMQSNLINMKHNESIQLSQPYKNQSIDHHIQYNNQDQNILNLSEIAFNQSEVLKENNSNLQNNCQLQNEQLTCLKDVFDKTSQSFYQQQNQINSQIQYSQNKIDHLQQQNNSFVGKIQDIQLKYDLIQKQLEQSQQENKSLKKQLSEEKNKNVNLQIRVDHLTKKSKSLQKKNELLLLEIDMNKKTYEMKCEALLKQIYNYQSLETIQDKGNQQQLNQINQQYETLLENFITINENGQNNNVLDISNSQVKNMQTFADPVDDKENIQMNNQFVKQENNSKLSSQFQSSKVSVSQDFINLIHNNEQYQNNQYNIIDMKDLQIQINPSSPFSNSNASKKLTMKLNQLSLINRNNQPYQINEDL